MKSAGIIKFNTGKIVLYPEYRVKDSASYASEPYIIGQNLDYKEIAEKLLETLEYSIDDAPRPLDWKIVKSNYLKGIGVKTMKALHNGSVNVSVFTREGNYYINPTVNKGSRQGFQGTKEDIIIPLSSNIEELGLALEEAFNKCS